MSGDRGKENRWVLVRPDDMIFELALFGIYQSCGLGETNRVAVYRTPCGALYAAEVRCKEGAWFRRAELVQVVNPLDVLSKKACGDYTTGTTLLRVGKR